MKRFLIVTGLMCESEDVNVGYVNAALCFGMLLAVLFLCLAAKL